MKKFSFKKKIFITVLFLIAINTINNALDPIVVIHAPDKFMLKIAYAYQYVEDKDLTEESLISSEHSTIIPPDDFSSWNLLWRVPPYSKLSMRWYFVEEVKLPNSSETAIGHIHINGDSISEDWVIKYQDIDFCRLDIYVGDNGKIARQEKSGWFCIK